MRYIFLLLFFSPWMVCGQGALLMPDSLGLYEEYGHSVAISDGFAFVGSPFRYEKRGAVLVYRKVGGEWVFDDELLASDGVAGAQFGYSIAIDGDFLVVGAPFDTEKGSDAGAVYIFRKDGVDWEEKSKLTASNGNQYDVFGNKVSVHENTIVVSAVGSEQCGFLCGAAYVFEKNNGDWEETGLLLPPIGGDWKRFGLSVGVDGDDVFIGSSSQGYHGIVYVYSENAGVWSVSQELRASDEQQINSSFFGRTLSVDGDYLVVGAPQRGEGVKGHVGAVYVFKKNSLDWQEVQKIQKLEPMATIDGYQFGSSISLLGDNLAIAANQQELIINIRKRDVFYYRLIGGLWEEERKVSFKSIKKDEYNLGLSVAIDAEDMLVGIPYSDTLNDNSGSAQVFKLSDLVPVAQVFDQSLDIQVFPNPTSNFIQLSWTNPSISTLSIEIKDMTGRTIKMIVGIGSNEGVDVAFLPQGIYLMTLYGNNKVLRTKKLVIFR